LSVSGTDLEKLLDDAHFTKELEAAGEGIDPSTVRWLFSTRIAMGKGYPFQKQRWKASWAPGQDSRSTASRAGVERPWTSALWCDGSARTSLVCTGICWKS